MVVTLASGEGEVKPCGQVSIIEGSGYWIRQGLIGLLHQNEPLRVLFDPTRWRHVRVVLSGQLLVCVLHLHQRPGFGYTQELVEAQLGFGGYKFVVKGSFCFE